MKNLISELAIDSISRLLVESDKRTKAEKEFKHPDSLEKIREREITGLLKK